MNPRIIALALLIANAACAHQPMPAPIQPSDLHQETEERDQPLAIPADTTPVLKTQTSPTAPTTPVAEKLTPVAATETPTTPADTTKPAVTVTDTATTPPTSAHVTVDDDTLDQLALKGSPEMYAIGVVDHLETLDAPTRKQASSELNMYMDIQKGRIAVGTLPAIAAATGDKYGVDGFGFANHVEQLNRAADYLRSRNTGAPTTTHVDDSGKPPPKQQDKPPAAPPPSDPDLLAKCETYLKAQSDVGGVPAPAVSDLATCQKQLAAQADANKKNSP